MTCAMDDYRSDEWLESLLGERPYMAYHPRWNALTGSPLASILLHQIVYHWWRFGRRPFFKFTAPCPKARPGESWLEELDFSESEFLRARHQIAHKCHKGKSRATLLKQWLVIFWTDAKRFTWYEVNEPLLAQRWSELSEEPNTQANPLTADYEIRLNPNPVIGKNGDYEIGKNADYENRGNADIYVTGETPITCSKKKKNPPNPKWINSSFTEKEEARESEQETPGGTQDPGTAPGKDGADQAEAAAALLWETLLREMRLQVDGATFDRWLARTHGLRLEQEVLQVRVTNAAAKDWLEHRLAGLVARTLGYMAPGTTVQFVVGERSGPFWCG
jgi:hypothetical protein